MIGPIHHMYEETWMTLDSYSDPYLAFSPIITHEPLIIVVTFFK